MTLLNFFKRHWQLAREVVTLRKEAETYRRQIGGYEAEKTKRVQMCEECPLNQSALAAQEAV